MMETIAWLFESPYSYLFFGAALGMLLARWRREKPSDVKRQERRADLYTFVLDAWAQWQRFAADVPQELLEGQSKAKRAEIQQEYANLRAEAFQTLRAAERQLQLHGARRVLRDYRRLQELATSEEASGGSTSDDAGTLEEAIMNVVGEMRRDLGYSFYNEYRSAPLGIPPNDFAEEAPNERLSPEAHATISSDVSRPR